MRNPNSSYKRKRTASFQIEDEVFSFKSGYLDKLKKDVERGWRKFKAKHKLEDHF